MLYQDFGIALNNWVTELEAQHYINLDDVVNTLCHKTFVFEPLINYSPVYVFITA
jgi:hypothetical protein